MAVLIAVYACHAMDRGLPAILVEPIRKEFQLRDSQLGLITGAGYGLAFAVAVIPMGMLSDRVSRRNLLAAIASVWSVCTALAGFATGAVGLVLARMGVGAAESGALSISGPLISDIFPPRQRAFAFGVYYINASLGGLLATVVGAFTAAEYGWRAAFLVVGGPGLLIALLWLTTVREPVRGAWDGAAGRGLGAERAPSLAAVAAHVAKSPALICLIAATAVASFGIIALGAWTAAFFMRVHHLGLKQVGLILGLGGGLSGALAPPLFGCLADRLAARDPAWTLRIVWISFLAACALTLTALFTPITLLAIACVIAAEFLRASFAALTFTVLTAQSPVPMRGTIMSMSQLVTVLAGFGGGPWLVGQLSDLMGGGTAIRYALAAAALLFAAVAPIYMAASHFVYGRRKAG